MQRPTQLRGFTLVEMIVVIVLIGIVAGALTPVIVQNINAYQAVQSRSELLNQGRVALSRLTRELRQAIPNSVNVVSATNIEFVTAATGGFYVDRNETRITNGSCPTANRFRSGFNLNALCVVHPDAAPFAVNDVMVVANTSPAELRLGNSRVTLNSVVGASPLWTVGFANHTFNNSSPGFHYSIVDASHEIALVGSGIRWLANAGYDAIYDNTGGDVTVAEPLLIDGVNTAGGNGGLNFDGSQLANGVLIVTLDLIDGGETITVSEEIYVRNIP